MTNTEKRQHWQQHMDAWQRSGLSQKAYCEREALSVANFGYWRKRLAGTTPAKKLIALGTTPVSPATRIHLPSGILIEVPTGSLATVLPLVQQAVAVGGDA